MGRLDYISMLMRSIIVELYKVRRRLMSKVLVIIATTIMGKGVKWMENDEKWHGTPIPKDKLAAAIEELGFDRSMANIEVYKGHATDKLTV